MALASAHELRIQLRKARIDLQIVQKRADALLACTQGQHQFLWGVLVSESPRCIDCGTATFCGVPHGAGHDHSSAAVACTAQARAAE